MRRRGRAGRRPAGFTLIELLIVILIILLLAAATLPTILPAVNHREIDEAARILQAQLTGARDQAIRTGKPHGVRLLLDPAFNIMALDRPLAASRIIAIEPAPDYSEGLIQIQQQPGLSAGNFIPPGYPAFPATSFIAVVEYKAGAAAGIGTPTSWFWNIRQGDKIRFGNTGRYYTVAGPVRNSRVNGQLNGNLTNTDRFVNFDDPTTAADDWQSLPGNTNYEFLLLVNGNDDDGDGFVDEGFDGIDNDADGIIDPGFNGIDDNGNGVVDEPQELRLHQVAPGNFIYDGSQGDEFEQEVFVLPQAALDALVNAPGPYTIVRRPVPSERASEVALPTNVVIDLTTWNAITDPNSKTIRFPERSRLPVDPLTGTVDIMLGPGGQVVPASAAQAAVSGATAYSSLPFYHFWLAERDDVFEPVISTGIPYLLPMSTDTDPTFRSGRGLKGQRRLVTLFTRTGQILTNPIEHFDINNPNRPYLESQLGIKEDSQ